MFELTCFVGIVTVTLVVLILRIETMERNILRKLTPQDDYVYGGTNTPSVVVPPSSDPDDLLFPPLTPPGEVIVRPPRGVLCCWCDKQAEAYLDGGSDAPLDPACWSHYYKYEHTYSTLKKSEPN